MNDKFILCATKCCGHSKEKKEEEGQRALPRQFQRRSQGALRKKRGKKKERFRDDPARTHLLCSWTNSKGKEGGNRAPDFLLRRLSDQREEGKRSGRTFRGSLDYVLEI